MRIASSRRTVPRASESACIPVPQRHRDVALGGQAVHRVGLHVLQQADQAVAVMQHETAIRVVWVPIQVSEALGVGRPGASLEAVTSTAFVEQQLGQVGAILAGDAGNQSVTGHAQTLDVATAIGSRRAFR